MYLGVAKFRFACVTLITIQLCSWTLCGELENTQGVEIPFRKVQPERFPWMAKIIVYENTKKNTDDPKFGTFGATGTLIKPDFVLTSANFFLNRNISHVLVYAGDNTTSWTTKGNEDDYRKSIFIFIHPCYIKGDGKYGIALVELEKPFAYLSGFDFFWESSDRDLWANREVLIAGWSGWTRFTYTPVKVIKRKDLASYGISEKKRDWWLMAVVGKNPPMCSSAGNDQINSGVACEFNTLHLECPLEHQVLRIVYAIYGRNTILISCPHPTLWMNITNCKSPKSKEAVEKECNGLHKCSVKAINEVFGNPCQGYNKYLEVKYECRIKDETFHFNQGGHPLLKKHWGKYIPAGVSQFFPWWDNDGKCLRPPINQMYTRVDVKDIRDWILEVMKVRQHIDVTCKKHLNKLESPKKQIDNKIASKGGKKGKAKNSHDANYLLSAFTVGFLLFCC